IESDTASSGVRPLAYGLSNFLVARALSLEPGAQILRRDFVLRRRDKCVYRSRTEIACRPAADRYRALGCFAIPRDEHVRDLLQLGLTDLIANLLLAVVELHAKPGGGKFVVNRRRIRLMAVGNRQHDGLNRRQPEWERAGVVLDQNGDEALEAAEDCTMNHDRPVLGVVGADVFQVEVLRLLVVELNRCALPLAPDRIRNIEIDLRPVERAIAFVQRVVEAGTRERLLQLGLRVIPR